MSHATVYGCGKSLGPQFHRSGEGTHLAARPRSHGARGHSGARASWLCSTGGRLSYFSQIGLHLGWEHGWGHRLVLACPASPVWALTIPVLGTLGWGGHPLVTKNRWLQDGVYSQLPLCTPPPAPPLPRRQTSTCRSKGARKRAQGVAESAMGRLRGERRQEVVAICLFHSLLRLRSP